MEGQRNRQELKDGEHAVVGAAGHAFSSLAVLAVVL